MKDFNEFELDFEDQPTIAGSDINEYDWDADEDEVRCAWCKEYYPITDCRRERELGYLCPQCQSAIKSRGEELVFIESADDKEADATTIIDRYPEDKDLTEDAGIADIRAELNRTLDSFTEEVDSKFILDEPADELEEADCKVYDAISHPEDDMKELKEEDSKCCPDCGKEICECGDTKLTEDVEDVSIAEVVSDIKEHAAENHIKVNIVSQDEKEVVVELTKGFELTDEYGDTNFYDFDEIDYRMRKLENYNADELADEFGIEIEEDSLYDWGDGITDEIIDAELIEDDINSSWGYTDSSKRYDEYTADFSVKITVKLTKVK